MPTYEYACSACDSSYEIREGFDAPTAHTCQECGNGTARRVLHAPPVVFKGSGWYVTDSRNKNSARVDGGESSSETKTESSDTKAEKPSPSPSPSPSAVSEAAASD